VRQPTHIYGYMHSYIVGRILTLTAPTVGNHPLAKGRRGHTDDPSSLDWADVCSLVWCK
jgi:hypothetical protein